MARIAVLICIGIMLFSVALAQEFVHYDNPFAGGAYPEFADDGTLWLRAGLSSVVSFVPSTGMHESFAVSKASSWRRGLTTDSQGGAWTASGNRVDHIYQATVVFYEFDEYLEAIAAAPDGTIWCSSWDRWLWRFDGQMWNPVAGCPERVAYQICFEPDGTGWFAYDSVLGRYSDGEWTLFEENAPGNAADVAVGSPGEVWITDGNLAHRFQDGVLVHSYGPDDGLPAYTATFVDVGPDGRVWVGSYCYGVSMFDGDQWTVFNTQNSGLPCNDTTGVAASPDGTVCICTQSGLAVYKDGVWAIYAGETVMNNDVWSVGVSDQGLVFYGTGVGQLGYYHAPKWEVLYSPEAYGDNNVCDIVFDHTGGIWFAEKPMLRVWRGTFTSYSRAGSDGIPLSSCKRLCCDNDGSVWVCARHGLARYDGTSWMSWPTESWSSPQAIALDQLGKVWVSIPTGVAAFLGNSVVRWLPQYQNVTAIACADGDALWLGFKDTGLALVDYGGELAHYTVDDGLPSNAINCIECDSDNNIWVGTGHGLGYFDGEQWTKWDIDSGLPVNEIRDISIAPNGDVWLATPTGLVCRESGVQPAKPSIAITTDRELYHAGDTMTVALSYENPGPDIYIDIQVACQLPDGSLFYYPGGDTAVPYISGMLPSGTTVPMVFVLIYDFPPDFYGGDYTWMTAMFEQGTFNMITDIATAPFTFDGEPPLP